MTPAALHGGGNGRRLDDVRNDNVAGVSSGGISVSDEGLTRPGDQGSEQMDSTDIDWRINNSDMPQSQAHL